MIKKLTSLITALCLMTGIIAFAQNDNEAETHNKEMELLCGLNIIGEDDPKIVTRAMFAQYVSNMINYYARPQGRSGVFSDVSENHEYSGAIYNLSDRGIVSGTEENRFDPDKPILYEQALKIILNAAGYGEIADYYGEYPLNYLMLAAEYKLNAGLVKQVGEELSIGETALLLSNTLKMEVPVLEAIGNNEVSFHMSSVNTFLEEIMKIRLVTGVMTDNSITSLTGNSKLAKDKVIVNNEILECESSKYHKYLGYRVDAYITYGKEKNVIYMTDSEQNNVLSVSSEMIRPGSSDFSVKKFIYEDINGKIKSVSINSHADFIVNNLAYPDATANDLCIPTGKIILIDNNSDWKYDVVLIKNSQTFVVTGISLEDNKIYGENGSVSIDLSYPSHVSITKEGRQISLGDIKIFDVVTCFVSMDKNSVEIIVSSRKAEGKVTEISENNNIVTINGEQYSAIENDIISSLNINDFYSFYLDYEGKIVDKDREQSHANVAMFRDAMVEKGLDGKVKIKIFTAGGKHEIYSCSDNLIIEGYKKISDEDLVDYLCTGAKNKLICYSLNSAGEISLIELAHEDLVMPDDKAGALQLFQKSGTYQYSGSQSCFNGKIMISSNTKVFLMPEQSDEDNKFKVTDISYFNHTRSYQLEGYSIGKKNGIAEYVIVRTAENETYSNTDYPIVIDSISDVLNDDGDVKKCIKGYSVNGEVNYYLNNEKLAEDLVEGDIIRCVTDVNKEVIHIKKVFDVRLKKIVNDLDDTYFSNTRSVYSGVYVKYNNIVGLTTLDISSSDEKSVLENMEYFNLNGAVIYRYDEKKSHPISKSKIGDIADYFSTNEEYSKFYMFTYSAIPRMIVIY